MLSFLEYTFPVISRFPLLPRARLESSERLWIHLDTYLDMLRLAFYIRRGTIFCGITNS